MRSLSSRRPLLVAALAAALLGAAVAPVAAQEAADRPEPADASEPIATRLAAPAKRFVVHAQVELSLSADAALEPVSVAPDVWYGVTPRLTAGLVHSSRATTGLVGFAGDGVCLAGEEGGCGAVYDRVGLLARLHVTDRVLAVAGAPISLGVDGGLVARSLEGSMFAVKVGALARWQRGRLTAELAPSLFIGVSERDLGNDERVHLPVSAAFAVTSRVAVIAQTGMVLRLAELRREAIVALSAGAQVMLGRHLFADVVFTLPRWMDTDTSTDGVDARALTIGVGRAF